MSDDDGIGRWEDPPAAASGPGSAHSYRWTSTAELLRKHPKRWRRLAETTTEGQSNTLVVYVNKGKGPFGPPGAFRATSRAVDGGRGVWACYLGHDDDS